MEIVKFIFFVNTTPPLIMIVTKSTTSFSSSKNHKDMTDFSDFNSGFSTTKTLHI